MQWYSDKRLLTDQDMTTTGDNIDYSIPKWKQAMSVNTNPSQARLIENKLGWKCHTRDLS